MANTKIVIIEDDETLSEVLYGELGKAGFDVSRAFDGEEGIKLVQSEKPDLVLLDVLLPKKRGFEVLKELKARPSATSEIPVIMLSALGEMDSVVKCIEMGAADYLPKPFDPVLLKARIGACLEKSRLVSERRQLQDQLRQAQKLESVGRLVGGVAHDFNNMLSVIISYAEQGIRKLPPNDGENAYLPQVLEAARHSTSLTRALLTFSHRQVVEPVVLDLNDVLINIHKMARRLISGDIELVILRSTEPSLVLRWPPTD